MACEKCCGAFQESLGETMNDKERERGVLDAQREHWQRTFALAPEMFGREPSYAARQAAELFGKEGRRKVLELGCGQGRDSCATLFGGRRDEMHPVPPWPRFSECFRESGSLISSPWFFG